MDDSSLSGPCIAECHPPFGPIRNSNPFLSDSQKNNKSIAKRNGSPGSVPNTLTRDHLSWQNGLFIWVDVVLQTGHQVIYHTE